MNRMDGLRYPVILQPVKKCYQYAKSLINQVIQVVWTRVYQAYYEPEKVILKIEMPLHPQKNTYPKSYKNVPWPHYLDQARGTHATYSASAIEAMAQKAEPLEKVTPLHAVAYKEKKSHSTICKPLMWRRK